MEKLGRGVVAIHQGDGKVFVSWRLLGTDPEAIAFNVYRAAGDGEPVKLNAGAARRRRRASRTRGVELDEADALLRPARARRQGAASASAAFTLPAERRRPGRTSRSRSRRSPGHTPNDASVGDLDGDGEYEIVAQAGARGRATTRRRGTTGETEARGLQARRHVPVADQPRQEHPRGGPLHAVPGLRPRRRRQGRGGLQDRRRHRRRHRAR